MTHKKHWKKKKKNFFKSFLPQGLEQRKVKAVVQPREQLQGQ
jgi:hypothetical protein